MSNSMLSFGRAWRVRPKKGQYSQESASKWFYLALPKHGKQTNCFVRGHFGALRGKLLCDFSKIETMDIFFQNSNFKTIRLTQDTTFLTKQEILRVLKRFCEAMRVCPTDGSLTYADLTSLTANYGEHLSKCPEIKVQQ